MAVPTADQLAIPEYRKFVTDAFKAALDAPPAPRPRLLDFLSAAHAAAKKGVHELTEDERLGLAIAAGVEIEMAHHDGDRYVLRTRQPITIAKFGPRFVVYVMKDRPRG